MAAVEAGHENLAGLVPPEALRLAQQDDQRAIPAIAKNAALVQAIEEAVRRLPTNHRLIGGDSRSLVAIPDETIHLVVTSPPYWTLKAYPERDGQLGRVGDYDVFLDELDKVWREAFRVLVPGGRMVIVVGDVCLSRRQFGRHVVYPLHASIQDRCRRIGFDNLAPIIWYKIAKHGLRSRTAQSSSVSPTSRTP